MKKLSAILTGVIILLLFSGCIYQTNDYYFYNVVAGDEPILSFSSNLDTVSEAITDSLFVDYEASVDVGYIYQVIFYFDDSLVYSQDTITNTFWINPSFVDSSGTYDLDLLLYYSTNTGSLADKLGGEYNIYEKSWSFEVNMEEK